MAYTPFRGFNWMSKVDGSKLLSELTIPGTHDTAGRYGGDLLITQTRTLLQQLTSGIRFLDIRCRHYKDIFAVHHDLKYENINFGTVLNICFKFLRDYPTETIIMSVKEEYDPDKNKLTFEQVFDKYVSEHGGKGKWYFGETIPKLDDVRGKIVLFRRFVTDDSKTVKGLKALPFLDNATFPLDKPTPMHIQDNWVVRTVFNRSDKWERVEKVLEEARKSDGKTLYVNFSSGSSAGSYPYTTANYVNPRLLEYFRKNTQGHFGIIPMDFEDTHRNILIAHTNAPYIDGYWILTNKARAKPFGNAISHRREADEHKTDAIDMAATSTGKGYWIAFKNGDVHAYGDANTRYGRSTRPNNDTVAIAARPDGTRYWLLFKDGNVNGFGGIAEDYGHGTSDGKEAVDIVSTPTGKGYWILSKDGGVHACGDAVHYKDGKGGDDDAVAMEITKDGTGYWILSKNGGVHNYGSAKYYGHGTGGHGDAVSIVRGELGGGYWILAKDGIIQRYGNVPYDGDGLISSEGQAVSLCRTLISGS